MNRPGGLTLGLTGGLASGKSTVARMLRERGVTVVDADRIVAELYEPGAEGARAVARLFGERFLTANGAVDRTAVAERVFANDEDRRRLEDAIHPLVRRRFEDLARETEGLVALEATLLVEAGWADAFDALITVEAPRDVRLQRAVDRGLSHEEADSRLRAQGAGDARRAAADYVIDNDGTLEDLERRVDEVLASLA